MILDDTEYRRTLWRLTAGAMLAGLLFGYLLGVLSSMTARTEAAILAQAELQRAIYCAGPRRRSKLDHLTCLPFEGPAGDSLARRPGR